ncbi:uncharacterized protein si:dkey-86e18.1 [Nothobranchius furzeri]|uniref:LOC107396465-like protein n=1 Tax=Nothobranchius furzeri TaxID=105023 RepID=A0A1A8UHA6_NOTFU|nr:putative LOC107396465-like protein [Nothobranchius furzeri]
MARNEEKQQGRLNRLWLQKEREEGRLKDANERRPKLSTLNSPSLVKKWIPSIKKEIEYYLQQSQLSHYPERKIAEFQQHIESLEKEYKSFISKLRTLDPSCKHKPWTPRAYCKRRADNRDSSSTGKSPRLVEPCDAGSLWDKDDRSLAGYLKPSTTDGACSSSDTRFQTVVSLCSIPNPSELVSSVQNEPLAFDRTRLAVAAAAFRAPSVQSSHKTQKLARVLRSGLPNLNNSSLQQNVLLQIRNTENSEEGTRSSVDGRQKNESNCETSRNETTEKAGHVLGLDCYSSSDEELVTSCPDMKQ